jgi:arginine N-succinyltransferase
MTIDADNSAKASAVASPRHAAQAHPAVRGARVDDLPRLTAWLGQAVSLPPADRAEQLWVAVDEADQPRATLRLVPAIGLVLPRVSWHVGCTVHAARELGLFHRQRTLLLGNDHTGATELADIAWDPADAAPGQVASTLQLLLAAALLHLAASRSAYAARLVAELPGVRDSAGQSPFWQGLGRHFYAADPRAAARQHGPDWRSLVAALLPRQVVYASFLTAAAQAAIAQVAPACRVLREALEDAGLRYGHHINVEDGGPVLEAETDTLPGVLRAALWRLEPAAPDAALQPWLLQAQPAAAADGPGPQAPVWRVDALAQAGALQLAPAALASMASVAQDTGLAPGLRVWAAPLRAAAAGAGSLTAPPG